MIDQNLFCCIARSRLELETERSNESLRGTLHREDMVSFRFMMSKEYYHPPCCKSNARTGFLSLQARLYLVISDDIPRNIIVDQLVDVLKE